MPPTFTEASSTGVFDAATDVDLGREVKDDVRPESDGDVGESLVADIHLVDLHVTAPASADQPLQLSAAQVVDDEHIGPVIDQAIDEVGSYESGAAGYKGSFDRDQVSFCTIKLPVPAHSQRRWKGARLRCWPVQFLEIRGAAADVITI